MPNHNVTIKPVTKPDLPAILSMARLLAAHHNDTPHLSLETLERDILGSPPWAITLIAKAKDHPAGYATLCPLIQLQWGVRGMDMHHLFVQPDWRGQGIATQLINAAIEIAADMGCTYMTVGTHPDNHHAQRLYQNAGFIPLPERGPRFSVKIEGKEFITNPV